MKWRYASLLVALPLLTSLILINPNLRDSIKAEAIGAPWTEEAIAPMGEDYSYTIAYTPANILASNPSYPSVSAGSQITTDIGGISMFSTNAYIGLTGETRDTFLTMGTWGMVQGHHNLGRITMVTIDIDMSKYANLGELGGAFGLQLRVGQNQEFANAEDNESGPTAIDPVTGIVTWDLTLRGRPHPFFLDETKLDNVSNFNFISTRDIYLDGITITGYHFMEISNGTTLRPVYAMGNTFKASLFTINTDNRTDLTNDDYHANFFDTTMEYPLSSMMVFSINCIYPYDGVHYLAVDTVKAIVVATPEEILSVTLAYDVVTVQVDRVNWKGDLATISYGGQDASLLPESAFDLEFYALGYQDVIIHLYNGMVIVPGLVTNNGATIVSEQVGVTGENVIGNISSMIVNLSGVTFVDHIDAVTPDNTYSDFTFDTVDGYIRLSPPYISTGVISRMVVSITIVGYEAMAGGGVSNRFQFAMMKKDNSFVTETLRYFTLTPSDTTVTLTYTNLSAYQGKGFSLYCKDIKDYKFTLKMSVNGFEYYPNVVTPEQQALFFARSFNTITTGLQGPSEDGVCVFDIHNDWSMLNEQFGYMHADAKTLLKNNGTMMQSPEVEAMIVRYQYIISTNPGYYVEFIGLTGGLGEVLNTSYRQDYRLPLLLVAAITTSTAYWLITKKKKVSQN